MRVFHFTEEPYPDAWDPARDSYRVNLPNDLCEPARAADLYHRYLDEWALADELGLDIMVNEHHSTATCLTASCHVILSILARITKRARLLALGIPLANRADPQRIAEEMSMIDVISRGRLEMGFVKGVPYEPPVANLNPARMMERLWESHDFILKAMTSRGGPFNFEGRHFHYRNVNIWPRPWQQPHPPVWITASSLSSAGEIARRGHVLATFLLGYKTRELFDRYREIYRATHNSEPGPDRFGYLALCAIARTREEAFARAQEVRRYITTTAVVHEPFRNPPGYMPAADYARVLRNSGVKAPRMVPTSDGRMLDVNGPLSLQDLLDLGLMFCGTPDEVFEQITRFEAYAGGIGNVLLMMQGGALSHEDTCDSLRLFGEEVLPRLKAYAAERYGAGSRTALAVAE
jgi:alkanesulfonate monooxygenase SsuD/methylene tetrahydromethanopterin reductase-like flavin-dependent oxidoreductase (luciferase family)